MPRTLLFTATSNIAASMLRFSCISPGRSRASAAPTARRPQRPGSGSQCAAPGGAPAHLCRRTCSCGVTVCSSIVHIPSLHSWDTEHFVAGRRASSDSTAEGTADGMLPAGHGYESATMLMAAAVHECAERCAPERKALHCRVPMRADVPAVPKLVAHELDDPAHCTWYAHKRLQSWPNDSMAVTR